MSWMRNRTIYELSGMPHQPCMRREEREARDAERKRNIAADRAAAAEAHRLEQAALEQKQQADRQQEQVLPPSSGACVPTASAVHESIWRRGKGSCGDWRVGRGEGYHLSSRLISTASAAAPAAYIHTERGSACGACKRELPAGGRRYAQPAASGASCRSVAETPNRIAGGAAAPEGRAGEEAG